MFNEKSFPVQLLTGAGIPAFAGGGSFERCFFKKTVEPDQQTRSPGLLFSRADTIETGYFPAETPQKNIKKF
jgi:hypothetical protein